MTSSDELALTVGASVAETLHEELLAGLDAAVPADVGPMARLPLAVALRGADGQLIGGLTGRTLWGWLVIELLWIAPAARGRGHAEALAEQHLGQRVADPARCSGDDGCLVGHAGRYPITPMPCAGVTWPRTGQP